MWFKIFLPHQHYPLAAMVGKDGKLYFRLVDVGALLGRSKVYEFAKRFDNLVIQGKDVLPAHKRYPVMTQRSKLVTPDELAERLALPERISTLPTQRLAEPERISTLPAEPERIHTLPAEPERMPTPPAEPERISPAEPERMHTPPAERPPLERVDPSVFVNEIEVTSSLITRCDKSTQTISPYLHVKRLDLGKWLLEQQQQANKRPCPTIKQEPLENPVQQIGSKNIVLLVPGNHPLMKLVPSTIYSWDPLSVEWTYEKPLPPSLYYKSRGSKASHIILFTRHGRRTSFYAEPCLVPRGRPW
ncbi:uncharacterized protein TNIN_440581 [Trichonephila inaurata madagascariensis]|uniref:Uncharacterized protein n=1 Tax=Trichonephila inaurata madagascariensis TaxID=2747483 RepID=A0A8X7CI40_9ARAC|nr:uncharacterized protein TNIN_440581 [Trichonephila inaurata madagascariensis]